MAHDEDRDDALREEVARLRAENELLRSRFRVEPDPPREREAQARLVRVLLLPDPAATPVEPGKIGPAALANVARVLVDQLRTRQPSVEWRAEHDLRRIPDDAECFQVGQVLRRMWDGAGPLPMTFRVAAGADGEPVLRRCLIDGEPDSDQFSAAYDRQLRVVDDLMTEGQIAYDAGAQHHAGWSLKATDVVLARLKLALATFQVGRDEWKRALSEPRPEYEPRYAIGPDFPLGL